MTDGMPDFSNLDTFPKLLRENVRVRADKPANREKDYGIWLSWTWAQVADEIRALACGMADIEDKRPVD